MLGGFPFISDEVQMLILTDDGPMICDNASNAVRDMRTGRPPRTAQQLARDDARLTRMVRDWAASKRHAHDSITLQDTNMPRFNADALFQRDSDSRDHGPEFARAWESRHTPRVSPRKTSRHAFDAEAATEAALKHLEDAKTHIEAVATGNREFNSKHFERMLRQSLEAMAGAEEEDAEDDDPDHVTNPSDHGGPPNVRAKDDGENPDHRKDFNDIKQGGADDAALFDANALFQR
jgi:hypothetical protein